MSSFLRLAETAVKLTPYVLRRTGTVVAFVDGERNSLTVTTHGNRVLTEQENNELICLTDFDCDGSYHCDERTD